MTQSSNDILLEIMQYCGENDIGTSFTQYDNKTNKIGETIILGKRVVEIQIGDPMKEGFKKQLSDFLKGLKR